MDITKNLSHIIMLLLLITILVLVIILVVKSYDHSHGSNSSMKTVNTQDSSTNNNQINKQCHANFPTVNKNQKILPYVSDGSFETTGFIVLNKKKIRTSGSLHITRGNDKNRLHYKLDYSGEQYKGHRSGFYTVDRFGVIHRIIEEHPGNSKEIHYQYSNAVEITKNKCVTQGSGSSILNVEIGNHTKCLETTIEKSGNKMRFYLILNGKIKEYVEW